MVYVNVLSVFDRRKSPTGRIRWGHRSAEAFAGNSLGAGSTAIVRAFYVDVPRSLVISSATVSWAVASLA